VTRFQVRMNGRLAFPRVCFGGSSDLSVGEPFGVA
jgi:hypothetical protein